VWVYYSAQIFLFGAEFTWVYAHERGSRRGEARPGDAQAAAAADRKPDEVQHRHFPLPVQVMPEPLTARPAANVALARERRSLRRRHPFGSLGIAFVAGVTVAAAQSLIGGRPLLARRAFPGADWLHGLKRRLT